MFVRPVNNELLSDAKEGGSAQYSDLYYYYDYQKRFIGISTPVEGGSPTSEPIDGELLSQGISDEQKLYAIRPMCLYSNTWIQSPVDVNGFIRHRMSEISRTDRQIRTYTSIVKKYRPIVMPKVRDIFNNCANDKTKYECDIDNDYGVFGWNTVPSKTMVDMQYNEESLYVPSTYDCHNRIGGDNFLQLDSDLSTVYRKWVGDKNASGRIEGNAQESWCYLYGTRDWTYFMQPAFNIRRNNDIYSYMLDTFWSGNPGTPTSSNHINGTLFETSTRGRESDSAFGNMVRTCSFLAKHHHGANSLKVLAERYTNQISYQRLMELT